MKVICAGFPKTGTKTLNAALTELGFNCFDSMESFRFHGDRWDKIFTVGGSKEDFRLMFEDVDAVMDIPCCAFWEQIHEAFPDAKIIFGMRESDEVWWKSMKSQLESVDNFMFKLMYLLSPTMRVLNRHGSMAISSIFGVNWQTHYLTKPTYNKLLFMKKYREHNAYVFAKAPEDKLHVVDFDKGWEPLCEFLGVPVPQSPFPHKNKGASMTKDMLDKDPFMLRLKREVMASASLITLIVGFGTYKLVTSRFVSKCFKV